MVVRFQRIRGESAITRKDTFITLHGKPIILLLFSKTEQRKDSEFGWNKNCTYDTKIKASNDAFTLHSKYF